MKILKRFSNKVFAVAFTALVAICLGCFVGLAHIAQAASTGTIGLGEDQKATVDVSSTQTATLTVGAGIERGSYLFVAYVTNLSEEEQWLITFSLQTSGNRYYIPYDSYIGGYTSVVEVETGDELTLSILEGDYDLTVEAHLETLSIGPANDYTLSGIQISDGTDAVVNLLDVPAGNYIASAEIIAETVPQVGMTVKVDNAEEAVAMTLNPNMYNAYTAPITVTTDSRSITLSTDSATSLSVNLTLYPEVTTTPLPTTAAEEFTPYEVRTYSYTAARTGYQVLNATATPSASSFSVVYKLSPNDFGGETVALDTEYPIYMEAGSDYYFTVSYFGDEAGASIRFSVENWTPGTVELNSEVVYAPVSNTTLTGAINYMLDAAGTYELDLVNVPYYDASITAHIGQETAVLNSDNNFTANVELDATGSIYFTTDYSLSFTVGVALSYTQRVYDDEIPLDRDITVNLHPGESLVYVVGRMVQETEGNEVFTGLTNGNYSVTLANANGQVVVSDANYSTPIVAAGESTGTFAVLLNYPDEFGYNGETERQQPVLVENIGTSELTFTIKVTAYTTNTLELGVAKEITLRANGRTTYFVEGLESGNYVITVGGTHSTIVVYNMADRSEPTVPAGASMGMYSFTLVPAREDPDNPGFDYPGETSRTLAYMIENVCTSAQTFTVAVNKVDSLELDTPASITFAEGESKTYYIGNLVSGTYNVAIEGGTLEVVAGGAEYSDGKLVVRATAGKYALVSLTFTSQTAQTVTVTITQTVDGTMTLGQAQSIALSYYDDTVSYSVELTPGMYRIELANVEWTGEYQAYWMVSVNDNYVIFGSTSAVFEITESGNYTITFMYYDMDSVSFDATITYISDRILVLGVDKEITLEANSSENYYIDLAGGNYTILLVLPEGTEIQVAVNGETVVAYGAIVGNFTISADQSYVQVTFTTQSETAVTFTVLVYAAA